MTLRPLLLALLLLCAPGAAAAAEPVRILSPLPRTLTSIDAVTILGTARRGTQVAWSVERQGKHEADRVRADWGDLFEIFLLLGPGLNRIRVEDQVVEVFYNPGNLQPPAGFVAAVTHARDFSRCDDCHEPLTMKLREGGYPGVCLACHVVESHNPADTRPPQQDSHFRKAISNCGTCHDAHVSASPKLLKGDANAVCGACHKPQLPAPGAHPAYEEGGCIACHDAHYSGYPKNLAEPLPVVCQRCHPQGAEEGKPHPPLAGKRSCALCHEPHGAGGALLRPGPEASCRSCHGAVLERGHGSELGECGGCHDPHRPLATGLAKKGLDAQCRSCHDGVGKGRTTHGALDRGCQACHSPHRNEDLSLAEAACGRCHDARPGSSLASLHGNLELPAGSCRACHPPHASEQARLVRGPLHMPLVQGKCSVCHGGGAERSVVVADEGARCRMCHPFERELAAPGARPHAPVAQGECSACHDPHIASRPAMLRGAEEAVCRACHPVADASGGRGLHEPARQCTTCHAAHGGPQAKFLAEPPPAQCLACHDDPTPPQAPHPALDEGCLACHDPHAGFLPGLLAGETPYAACLACHTVPDLSRGRSLHTAARRCGACHDPHGGAGPKYLREGTADPGCARCHDIPGEGRGTAHAALDDGCGACHDPHAGFGGAALLKPVQELCLDCHDDPGAGKAVPHRPGDRACAACHEPHASLQKHLLRAQGEALCRSCHDFRENEPGRSLHAPAQGCDECHERAPHGGAKPRLLRSTPPGLCLECHEDPAKAPGGGAVHPALDDGCLSCHDPHAGFGPGVLRGAGPVSTCLECHEDPAAGRRFLHQPAADRCSACHEPHASANRAFLRRPGNALCTGCHDPAAHRHSLDAERGRRFPGSAAFPSEGGRYRCEGCHDPHASNERKLYRLPEKELCVACHRI